MSQWGKPYSGECEVDGVAYRFVALPHYDGPAWAPTNPNAQPDVVLLSECIPLPPSSVIHDAIVAVAEAQLMAERRCCRDGREWDGGMSTPCDNCPHA